MTYCALLALAILWDEYALLDRAALTWVVGDADGGWVLSSSLVRCAEVRFHPKMLQQIHIGAYNSRETSRVSGIARISDHITFMEGIIGRVRASPTRAG
jgi:hypothetical protein